jgi:hypothetical protein
LTGAKEQAPKKVNNILDNIMVTNREFADARIAALRNGLKRIEPRLSEHEAASEAVPDLDRFTDKLLGCMGTIEDVVGEGTVDEKRSLIRAFVQQVQVYPESRETRLLLRELPQFG